MLVIENHSHQEPNNDKSSIAKVIELMVHNKKALLLQSSQKIRRLKIISQPPSLPGCDLFLEVLFNAQAAIAVHSIDLSLLWGKIQKKGFHRVQRLVDCWNSQGHVNKTIQLQLSEKTLRCKMEMIENKNSHSHLKNLQNNLQFLQQKYLQLMNDSEEGQSKKLHNKLKSYSKFLQALRKERAKASSFTLKSQTFLKQQDLSQSESTSFFLKETERLEKQLRKKFSKQPKIFRSLKELEVKVDQTWKQPTGNNLIQKCIISYEIFEKGSIHNETTKKMMEGSEQDSPDSQDESAKDSDKMQKTVVKDAILMKKTSQNFHNREFDSEKKILAYLRFCGCASINNFYCVQGQQLNQISYIYSQYQPYTINFSPAKIKNPSQRFRCILKIIQTFFQGLLFLRFNGVSHRDLKPHNILLSKDFKSKIIDFGSACHNRYFRPGSSSFRVSSYQLFTTARYNLNFEEVSSSIKHIFSIDEYECHPYFDLHAFGVILGDLVGYEEIKYGMGSDIWDYFQYISSLCQEINPEDRPDPKYLYSGLITLLNQFT